MLDPIYLLFTILTCLSFLLCHCCASVVHNNTFLSYRVRLVCPQHHFLVWTSTICFVQNTISPRYIGCGYIGCEYLLFLKLICPSFLFCLVSYGRNYFLPSRIHFIHNNYTLVYLFYKIKAYFNPSIRSDLLLVYNFF